MKAIRQLFFLISLGMLLIGTGCASTSYPITLDSHPQGAMVICGGVNQGYTPVTRYFDKNKLNAEIKANPNVVLNLDEWGCSANWVSGATAAYQGRWPIESMLSQFPNGAIVTVQRPSKAPGLQQDAEFALKVQQTQAQQAMAVAAQSQADAAWSQATAAQVQAAAAQSQAMSAQQSMWQSINQQTRALQNWRP